MDKEMSELEAFEAWFDEKYGKPTRFSVGYDGTDSWDAWQAACKRQREKDAEICRQLNLVSDAAWVEGTLDCAAAILNQGGKGSGVRRCHLPCGQ